MIGIKDAGKIIFSSVAITLSIFLIQKNIGRFNLWFLSEYSFIENGTFFGSDVHFYLLKTSIEMKKYKVFFSTLS